MAQNQREINRLRHIIEEKDREIEMLRENENDSGRADPGITEDFSHRVTELEGMVEKLAVRNTQVAPQDTRINELEGMVKGLTEELLDLKAEVRKYGKVLEGKEELKPRPDIRRARPVPEKKVKSPEQTVKRSEQTVKQSEQTVKRSEQSSQYARQPAEPELDTASIMQPDGTLAEEPRMNDDDLIVAGNRPAKMYQSKSNRDYRGKDEKKPLIYADEDDTVEIKKK